MMFRNKTLLQILIIALIMVIPIYVGALNVNQTIELKKNGSGTLTVAYSANETEVKSKNFLIGNFPFTKEKIDEYFKTTATVVYSTIIEKHPKDNSLTQVTVVLGFNNISKLSEMKAFNGINVNFLESDSGTVYRYVFTQPFIKSNSLENAYMVLKYENNVKLTNGTKTSDKGVMWFRGKEYIDGKNDINFYATFESDVNISKNNSSKGGDDKGKSCGLFGIELPLIIFAGLVFSYNKKRFKK